MKKLSSYFMPLLMWGAAFCTTACSSSEEVSDYSCFCATSIIKELTNERGELQYDDELKSWFIHTNSNGDLYPEVHAGSVNIDKDLKKNEQQVVFSGDVYPMYIDNHRGVIDMGQYSFCLDLLNITALDDFIDFDKIMSFCQITWRLQGYGNPTDWHSVEGKNDGNNFIIAFREDLNYRGQAIANRFVSGYLYSKDGLFIQNGFSLITGNTENDADALFFEENLPKANKLVIDNQGFMKLFYSDQDYFYFKNEGKSED